MSLHGQFFIGVLISMAIIALQAMATLGCVRVGRAIAAHSPHKRPVTILVGVMAAIGALLTLAHCLEAGVWGLAYDLLGVAPSGDAYYLAFVNFTTLGYGDLLPDPYWRLLAPMTAASGMLMFGWSTAVMFAVLQRAGQLLHLVK